MNKDRIMNIINVDSIGIGFYEGYFELAQDSIDKATEREVKKLTAEKTPETEMQTETDFDLTQPDQA